MTKSYKTPGHKQVIDLVDWLRANHNRINAADMNREQVAQLASKEIGFDFSWGTIRKTAASAGVTLKLRLPQYGSRMTKGRIDETLGQMCCMLDEIAPFCDVKCMPLVQLAADQYLEQKANEQDEARHQQ